MLVYFDCLNDRMLSEEEFEKVLDDIVNSESNARELWNIAIKEYTWESLLNNFTDSFQEELKARRKDIIINNIKHLLKEKSN